MDQKKIIWIVGALAVTGLVAYAAFHSHRAESECFVCRSSINWVEGIAFAGGATLGLTFNCCLEN